MVNTDELKVGDKVIHRNATRTYDRWRTYTVYRVAKSRVGLVLGDDANLLAEKRERALPVECLPWTSELEAQLNEHYSAIDFHEWEIARLVQSAKGELIPA